MVKKNDLRIDLQADLIARCRGNDKRAQILLYQQYAKAMYTICMNYVHNTYQAEEMMQESFISAFKNMDQYKGEVSFGAWLKKIVINKCLDELKKKKIEFDPIDNHPYLIDSVEENNEIFNQQNIIKIHKAIALLPEGYRTILSLFLLEGYDHEEIAEILGISASTSRSQYTRARAALVKLVKDMQNG